MDAANEISERMRLQDGVYVLGSSERRVTIYAQQVRALNLAWALNELSLLNRGTRIAVVGAGAGG